MQNFSDKKIESLILGCTHYPIIKDMLKKYLDSNVVLIDPAVNTAKEAKKVLKKRNN